MINENVSHSAAEATQQLVSRPRVLLGSVVVPYEGSGENTRSFLRIKGFLFSK